MSDILQLFCGLSLFVAIAALLALVWLAFRPFKLKRAYTPDPVRSYDEAAGRIQALLNQEAALPDLNQVCASRFMTHGEKTPGVILFLHGFTNCPRQFAALGEAYFRAGYNVYIPRIPRHGLFDRLGNSLQGCTAEELVEYAGQSLDIACGLGERVIVCGLSGGGVLAGWLGQVRPEVDLAALIAPFVGVRFIAAPLNRPLVNLILRAPDFFQWWDPLTKENNPLSMPYAYVRYPTHALFDILRLAYTLEAELRRARPQAHKILVISNANDESIHLGLLADFEGRWAVYGGDLLETYQFDRMLKLPHDLITPDRPDSRVEVVYPKILELVR